MRLTLGHACSGILLLVYRYRTTTESVPEGLYKIPLGQARIVRQRDDVTLVGWGAQVWVLTEAAARLQVCLASRGRLWMTFTLRSRMASPRRSWICRHCFHGISPLFKNRFGRQVDIFCTRQISTCEIDGTGHLVVSHEAPVTSGFGAEIVSKITDTCFYSLEKPPKRICGMDTHFPLVFEPLYLPTALRVAHTVRSLLAS